MNNPNLGGANKGSSFCICGHKAELHKYQYKACTSCDCQEVRRYKNIMAGRNTEVGRAKDYCPCRLHPDKNDSHEGCDNCWLYHPTPLPVKEDK